MTTTVARDELDQLVGGTHHNPHSVLGAHPMPKDRTVVRTLRPEASAVSVIIGRHRTGQDDRLDELFLVAMRPSIHMAATTI